MFDGKILIKGVNRTEKEPLRLFDRSSVQIDWEVNSTWSLQFVAYDDGSLAYNMIENEASVFIDGQEYIIKHAEEDSNAGVQFNTVTATHVYFEVNRLVKIKEYIAPEDAGKETDVKVLADNSDDTTSEDKSKTTTVATSNGGAARVIAAAKKYLGVPYVLGGNHPVGSSDPMKGMDCSSLTGQIYKDLGITIGGWTVPQEKDGTPISRDQVQTGDLGFVGPHGGTTHVVMALDHDTLIQESEPGVPCNTWKIDNYYHPLWWIRNSEMAKIVAGGTSTKVSVKTTDETEKEEQQVQHTVKDVLEHWLKDNKLGFSYEIIGDFKPAMMDELAEGSGTDMLSKITEAWPNAIIYPDNRKIRVYTADKFNVNHGNRLDYINSADEIKLTTDTTTPITNMVYCVGGKYSVETTTDTNIGSSDVSIDDKVSAGEPAVRALAKYVALKLNVDPVNVYCQLMFETGAGTHRAGTNNYGGVVYVGQEGATRGLHQPDGGGYYANFNTLKDFGNAYAATIKIMGVTKGMSIDAWAQQLKNRGYYGAPVSQYAAGMKTYVAKWNAGDTKLVSATSGGNWAWPFPSVGEGTFQQVQSFGYDGGFRQNGFHDGLDFGSVDHPGSEVHAIHGGKVTHKSYMGGLLNYVVVHSNDGYNVVYQEAFSSMAKIKVNIGDTVKTGDIIGWRDTSHLHIGITKADFMTAVSKSFTNDGTWLDPRKIIKNGLNAPADDTSSDSEGDDSSSSTSSEEFYYFAPFWYRDEESIKKYGERPSSEVFEDDSIKDKKQMEEAAKDHIEPQPPLTVDTTLKDSRKPIPGDVIRVSIRNRNISEEFTVTATTWYPFSGNDNPTAITLNTKPQNILDYFKSRQKTLNKALKDFENGRKSNGNVKQKDISDFKGGDNQLKDWLTSFVSGGDS